VSNFGPFDPERLLTTLARHQVRYVLIGAVAARLQGFPRLTADLDVTPAADADNLTHLAAALRELGARVFTESVPEGLAFDCTPRALARGRLWNLITVAGRLDLVFQPSGTSGYDDLVEHAIAFEVFGSRIVVASLADIIRSKEAADRPQDWQDVILMREMLQRERT
jgi:hypothetical protein